MASVIASICLSFELLKKSLPCQFYSFDFAYKLSDDTQILGKYAHAFTDVDVHRNSIFTNFEELESNSMKFALVKDFNIKHKIGLSYSQPLRVNDGQLSIAVPVKKYVDGTILYEHDNVDLEPTGREKDWEVFYDYKLNDKEDIGGNLIYREDPGHVNAAQDEKAVLFKYTRKF